MFYTHLRAHSVCESRSIDVSVSKRCLLLWRARFERMNTRRRTRWRVHGLGSLKDSPSEFIYVQNEFKRISNEWRWFETERILHGFFVSGTKLVFRGGWCKIREFIIIYISMSRGRDLFLRGGQCKICDFTIVFL